MSRHSFGPAHPQWGKLLELRRSGLFIKDLLKIAHEAGYVNLTYEALRLGFHQVSSGFGLPTRSAMWLKRKHESTAALINSAETMVFALMETLEDWQAAKEERAQAGHSEAYRTTLANREHKLRDTVFGYAERIRNVQLDLERLSTEGGGMPDGTPGFVVVDVETMRMAIESLMGRWTHVIEGRLGGDDLDAAVTERFGSQNIRPALLEPDVPPPQDEEDFTEEND